MPSKVQFIPEVFSGVKIRVLFRPLEFFHVNNEEPRPYENCLVHRGIVGLEQV